MTYQMNYQNTYAVTYTDYLTNRKHTEFGDITKVKNLIGWLAANEDDYLLLSVESYED